MTISNDVIAVLAVKRTLGSASERSTDVSCDTGHVPQTRNDLLLRLEPCHALAWVETCKEGTRAKEELRGVGDGKLAGWLDEILYFVNEVVDSAAELAGRDEGISHGDGAEEDEVEGEAHLEGSLGLKLVLGDWL